MSDLEDMLAFQLTAVGIPYVRQAVLVKGRRWRWDFAMHAHKLAVEVQGGLWSGGSHVTGAGVTRDIEKHNALILAGWRDLFVTGAMIRRGEALRMIERCCAT